MNQPVIDPESYDFEKENNDKLMMDKITPLIKQLFPDIMVPYDQIYKILSFLEETQVNPTVIPKIIRGIHNIEIGTGKGQVIVHVQQEMVNVSIREQDSEELKTKI